MALHYGADDAVFGGRQSFNIQLPDITGVAWLVMMILVSEKDLVSIIGSINFPSISEGEHMLMLSPR